MDWIVLVGALTSSKHSFMHFFVHSLDVYYALLRPLYERVCLGLTVICSRHRLYLILLFGQTCLDFAFPLGKLIDFTSPCLENFLVLNYLAFSWVNLNSSMEIRNLHNIMYIPQILFTDEA